MECGLTLLIWRRPASKLFGAYGKWAVAALNLAELTTKQLLSESVSSVQ
jgi:hypothetical protein